jgi:hypothetical protein
MIAIVDKVLEDLGYTDVDLAWSKTGKAGTDGYNKDDAAANREKNLKGLKQMDYSNAVLPKRAP